MSLHYCFFEPRFRRHSRVGSSSGSGVPCAGRRASGTLRRFTRMRVQVDDRPRMESTRTSSTPRSPAISGCRSFHLAKPSIADSLLGELAITSSGILVRGAWVADFCRGFLDADFARDGATRGASPVILLKWGGQGASARPSFSSLAASSSSRSSDARRSIHLAVRITALGKAFRHSEHGKVRRFAIGNLMPVKWRRDAGVRKWAD